MPRYTGAVFGLCLVVSAVLWRMLLPNLVSSGGLPFEDSFVFRLSLGKSEWM